MPFRFKTAYGAAKPRSNARNLVVLVVEDDEADAYLISRALANQSKVSEIVRAVDGVEASEMIDRGDLAPDLAFIDLQMPRKNGLSLMMDFATRPGLNFPMVVLTSSTAATDAARSRLSGAVRVVSKPDTIEAMELVLGAAIDAVCPKETSLKRPQGRVH
jgi:CheY-like chemotaxis protein